jgi:colanic acid biosynthesis glycosyl transferase WcaI
MKILFLSDNFPPERNAPASRTYEHAIRWVQAGHEVTVITTAPNFPEGELLNGYRNRWYSKETQEGIKVIRVKSYMTANDGFLRRTLDYMSFMVSGGVAALFQPRPDVLVSTSPQFFCAVAGWFVSRVRRLPWVFELRDLWPSAIVAVGAMRKGATIRMLERLELAMYRAADLIVAVTQGLKDDLVARKIEAGKIVLVRNGVDQSLYSPRPKDEVLLDQFNLRGKFVVGFLGTMGMAAGLEKVMISAEALKDRPDIVLLFAGPGSQRKSLEHKVRERGLSNVRMIPAQSKEMMPRIWSVLDLSLSVTRDEPLFLYTVSSKNYEAMAMGLPILMSMPDGECAEIVRNAGAGVLVPAEDPVALASAIRKLADSPADCARMGQAALAAAPRFTREKSAEQMLDALGRLVSGLPARIEPEASADREVTSSLMSRHSAYKSRITALGDRS